MPRRPTDELFEERPEWTKRKHDLLARIVVPASMKMRKMGGSVALIDGYAGANTYGDEEAGSTVIMVKAARQVRTADAGAKVFACEPDLGRFEKMCSSLRSDIESGILVPFNSTHADALPQIQKQISTMPAIVFLDPHAVTQMSLNDDILPWATRPFTDVLGVFMAGQACRCCAQLLKAGQPQRVHPREYLGDDWQSGSSEDGAFNTFFAALGKSKRFKGMYRLRKLDIVRHAYGIFGLSDHPDGYTLLSNAVAKDFGLLENFEFKVDKEVSLFADVDREERQRSAFDALVEISRETIREHPELRGAKLASKLFASNIGVEKLFGKYSESDYTRAAIHVLGLPSRRKNAKTKRD